METKIPPSNVLQLPELEGIELVGQGQDELVCRGRFTFCRVHASKKLVFPNKMFSKTASPPSTLFARSWLRCCSTLPKDFGNDARGRPVYASKQVVGHGLLEVRTL